ncbi:hypothetical protein GCM10008018_59090 [Paenibacillus marchantiophytorum]|uniref:TraB/GumN family protein n=2 Tax=Paenibacillus marchantiophytorum TaxID=1619310 RepID=A0ABQ1FBN3_9BACL|nr:hypothetical protein GCM10008018_59090 [Paenibacillus marchantiophytorum]
MGYEGDCHLGVFKECNIVWLDHSRVDVNQKSLDNFSTKRFDILKNSGLKKNDKDGFFKKLSQYIRGLEDNNAVPSNRDAKFANTIIEYVKQNNCSSGIVVVGSNHASNKDSMMRYLLEQEGYDCFVKLL